MLPPPLLLPLLEIYEKSADAAPGAYAMPCRRSLLLIYTLMLPPPCCRRRYFDAATRYYC